jgi:FAD/FMN-containing dehydrogenase
MSESREQRSAEPISGGNQHAAVCRLLLSLRSVAADPRSRGDRRHVAEHAVAHVHEFLKDIAAPTEVLDAMLALVFAFDDLDRGRPAALFARVSKTENRSTKSGEVYWKQAATAVLRFFLVDSTEASAAREMHALLKRHGADVPETRLHSLIKEAKRPRKTQPIRLTFTIHTGAEAEQLGMYLARNSALFESKSRQR